MSDNQHVLRTLRLERLKNEIRQLLFDADEQGEEFQMKVSRSKQSVLKSEGTKSVRSRSIGGKCEQYNTDVSDVEEERDNDEMDNWNLFSHNTRSLFDLQKDLCRFCDHYPFHGKACHIFLLYPNFSYHFNEHYRCTMH